MNNRAVIPILLGFRIFKRAALRFKPVVGHPLLADSGVCRILGRHCRSERSPKTARSSAVVGFARSYDGRSQGSAGRFKSDAVPHDNYLSITISTCVRYSGRFLCRWCGLANITCAYRALGIAVHTLSLAAPSPPLPRRSSRWSRKHSPDQGHERS